jgi:hypothetical protein
VHDDLDPSETANQARLTELLTAVAAGSKPGDARPDGSDAQARLVQWTLSHITEFREAVDLARQICDAQSEAFLKKLARAYQRPDFCIRRDSVGSACEELLPSALSWDENWYYGRTVEYMRKER